MNRHLEWQAKLAGAKTGGGSNDYDTQSGSDIYHGQGETPDSVPDIGGLVPVERVD